MAPNPISVTPAKRSHRPPAPCLPAARHTSFPNEATGPPKPSTHTPRTSPPHYTCPPQPHSPNKPTTPPNPLSLNSPTRRDEARRNTPGPPQPHSPNEPTVPPYNAKHGGSQSHRSSISTRRTAHLPGGAPGPDGPPAKRTQNRARMPRPPPGSRHSRSAPQSRPPRERSGRQPRIPALAREASPRTASEARPPVFP